MLSIPQVQALSQTKKVNGGHHFTAELQGYLSDAVKRWTLNTFFFGKCQKQNKENFKLTEPVHFNALSMWYGDVKNTYSFTRVLGAPQKTPS